MAISSPQLISCSARIEESVIVRVANDAYIFAIKNHKGSPLREIETFTKGDIEKSGPFFFNVIPVKIEVLDQVFRFVSAITLNTESELLAGDSAIVRFYWNQIAGRNTGENLILYADYNVITNELVSAVRNIGFEGIDPFIMDARTGEHPNRLYIVYITEDGNQTLRVSEDLGQSWSGGCAHDSDIRWIEGIIRDPQGKKELIRIMQQQSAELIIDPQGDAYIDDFSTTPIQARLIQRIYPFNRRPPRINVQGKDDQRFRRLRPLVIRVPPVREPC